MPQVTEQRPVRGEDGPVVGIGVRLSHFTPVGSFLTERHTIGSRKRTFTTLILMLLWHRSFVVGSSHYVVTGALR